MCDYFNVILWYYFMNQPTGIIEIVEKLTQSKINEILLMAFSNSSPSRQIIVFCLTELCS